MIAIIFELEPADGKREAYLDHAATLRPMLMEMDGFLSVERFESLSIPGKLLSISFWRDEAAVAAWRNHEVHRRMQRVGRTGLFAGYRLRVAGVIRDYSLTERDQAPSDAIVV
ncbi:MAG: antibiotic biosynthesis monooxygenase [Pseudomonadota bacterium]